MCWAHLYIFNTRFFPLPGSGDSAGAHSNQHLTAFLFEQCEMLVSMCVFSNRRCNHSVLLVYIDRNSQKSPGGRGGRQITFCLTWKHTTQNKVHNRESLISMTSCPVNQCADKHISWYLQRCGAFTGVENRRCMVTLTFATANHSFLHLPRGYLHGWHWFAFCGGMLPYKFISG